ncbi:ankyrin [Neocallimastix lanati (nom. inval.)]|uniref:Ankyrin n=1 Tax=Neocallimastix californiae TaxID=1754190 RepID=A0A1Y1YNL9_9FUNG|nr:ankyrin [Neocallimastix sp. JGI-2020a]ORX99601.1 ankyrin [Neocallimastix californiae]|eukprot:ORX99601.1 ankyrin [Neocallimastix californiae]
MITEEELIEYIKNKQVKELSIYFKENNIISENFDNFNKILLYFIKNDSSIEYIKFIINRQKNKENIEALFQTIQYNKFKKAKLLIKNGANINGLINIDKNNYYNIIEYLLDYNYLDLKNIKFIIKNNFNGSIINSKLICNLIKDERNDILKLILQNNYFSDEFINNIILREFLIKRFKNRNPLSSKELKQLLLNRELQFRIDINEKEKYGNYPLLQAINYNNLENVELLMNYADKHGIVLTINDKDEDDYFPLLQSIRTNSWGNINIIRALIEYANRHNIILNVNEKDLRGNFCLLQAIANNNIEIVNLLLEYSNSHNIVLNIKEKDNNGNYPLLQALDTVDGVNTDIINLLISYANDHQIILNINEKNSQGNYPVLQSVYKNNSHATKQLMKYAKKKKFVLNINEVDNEGYYPLYFAVKYKNIKLIKMLFKYAKYYNITLKMDEKLSNKSDCQLISSLDI